jgi:replicative DNA helicase
MHPIDSEVASLRVPPHSVEAEQSVLGGLLIDNSAWDRASDLVSECDFYRLEHRLIFAAIGRLIVSGKPADVITVDDSLRIAGTDEDCGGLIYLNALAQSVPSASNIRRYAEIVRERAVLRRLIAVADEISTAALNPQGRAVADILDAAESSLQSVTGEGRRAAREPRRIDSLLVAAMDRINAAAEGDFGDCWPIGWPTLDRAMKGGLRPGKLIILAARPSVGKSSASMAMCLRIAGNGHPVLFLSQEMPDDELTDRAISSAAGVDGEAIASGHISDAGWGALVAGVEDLRGMPLWIDDQPAMTLMDIRSKARRIKGLKLLVVDYLQLCSSTLTRESRTAQVGEISRGLKALAKELGICVIALSQLNREVEKRPGKRPQMSDLRDSGEIEQDADSVLFLWPLTEKTESGSMPIGLDVAKNRGGRRPVSVMRFDPSIQRWHESTEQFEEFTAKTKAMDL